MNETKAAVNGVLDAFTFAVSGFSIVFIVLLLVIISVILILKAEKKLTGLGKHSGHDAEEPEAMHDPLTLVLISAAIGAIYGNIHMRKVRRIGADTRQAGAWGQAGRSQHQGSHTIKLTK